MTARSAAALKPAAPEVRLSIATRRLVPSVVRHAKTMSDDQFDEAQLLSLYRVSKLVMADLNLDTTLRAVMESARSLIKADMVGIMLLEEDDRLVIRATSGVTGDIVGKAVQTVGTLAGRCIADHQAALVPDMTMERRLGVRTDLDGSQESRCYILAPLVHGDAALGLMTIGSQEPGVLNEGDLALAVALAEQAGSAVANARAYREEEQRRAASEQLSDQLARRTEELEAAQRQLVTNEKLIAIGKLAAGVAHEINTPLSVVMSNLHVLERYCQQLGTLVSHVEAIVRDVDIEAPEGLQEAYVKADAEYILND
jgi:two-component system NtrC family sensor kinase